MMFYSGYQYFYVLCVISHFYHVYCDRSENQKHSSSSNAFQLWFFNETTLTVLWEAQSSSQVKDYKFYLKPPDSNENERTLSSQGEPVLIHFTKLVPGRAYTIFEEILDTETVSHNASAVYQTKPLPPLALKIAEGTISSHSFKILWEPPDDVCDFDKFELYVFSPKLSFHKTFDKIEKREYVVNKSVLPGHLYRVALKTISGLTDSSPITAEVTLQPLPVMNVSITPESVLTWNVDPVSMQQLFHLTVRTGDSSISEEIPGDKRTLFLGQLAPGRQYNIQIEAISNGIKSNSTVIQHATLPLPPVVNPVLPVADGLNITWRSDVSYGHELFQVRYHGVDVNESGNVLTNNTQLLLTHLHPGALYGVKVISISKYGNSSMPEVYQHVMPLPPCNLTASYVNVSSLSLTWDAATNSYTSHHLVQYRVEDQQEWKEITLPARITREVISDLSSGERYKIQVSSVSDNVGSTPVKLQWITPPAPVTHVVTLPSANSIGLKFPRPQGRIEYYKVTYNADHIQKTKVFTPNKNDTQEFVLLSMKDLTPGSYVFSLTTVSYHMESSVTITETHTWPDVNVDLNLRDTLDALTINYIPPLIVHFDTFRFSLSESNVIIYTANKSSSDSNRSVQFNSLVPGRMYTLYVCTVSDGMLSDPTQLQYRTQPGTVRDVNATNVTSNSITLSWTLPEGDFSQIEVAYMDTVLHTFNTSVNVTQLQSYHNYTFQIRTIAGIESTPSRSSAVVFTAQTLESRPGKVSSFHPVTVNAQNITLVWSVQPKDRHGVITQFKLFCIVGEWSKVIDISPERRTFTVTDLKPGKTYVFKIQARTKVGFGPSSVWQQVMPVLAPPQPAEQLVPTSISLTTTTIQIRFYKNFFSNEYGEILYYAIIVSEDLHDNSSSKILNLPAWHDVQTLHPWPPYQVASPFQFFPNISSAADFTVGVEACGLDALDEQYCNGPLKSGATYKIKVRAFTKQDLFTDTVYSAPIRTKQNPSYIVFLTSLLVVAVALVLVAFIGRRLFKRQCDVPSNCCSHPVTVDFLKTWHSDVDSSWILSEFESLRLIGKEQTTIAAELPCNRPKNRFSNILPYDHSRYKLQPVDDEEGSDYVNANYIAGHASPRQYIATQGPLSTTLDEFWRMCWESRTPAIVMLTQCVEKGRQKCFKYWPSKGRTLRCGELDVRLLQVSQHRGWCISRLQLSCGGESRVVHHFHFTTWPDKGVPVTPEALVRFVLSFRSCVSVDQNPVVVHCSAGVGRTGSFIAVDTIAQNLHNVRLAGSVDVLSIVYQLRKQRMCMVQTVEQYLYIYLCVKLLLLGRGVVGYSMSQDLVFSNEAFVFDEGVDDL